MRQTKRAFYLRIATALGAAVVSLAASIVLPSAVITLYTLYARDTELINAFAVSVAEPLGILGAAAATFGFARLAVRKIRAGRALIPWIGGAAAGSIVAAAFWVGDVDVWTAAAALILPSVAILAARNQAVQPVDPPPAVAAPPSVVARPPAETDNGELESPKTTVPIARP